MKAVEHAELFGTGFLDRFLYVMPKSSVGHRGSGRTPDRSDEVAAWEWLIRSTFDSLSTAPERRLLRFNALAEHDFTVWQDMTKGRGVPMVRSPRSSNGPRSSTVKFIRLAALIALADDAEATTVDGYATCRAMTLLDYFVDHARAALALVDADGPMAAARTVAACGKARHERTFSRRELHRAFDHRFRTIAELLPVIELLTEYGYVRDGERIHRRPPVQPSRDEPIYSDVTDRRDERDERRSLRRCVRRQTGTSGDAPNGRAEDYPRILSPGGEVDVALRVPRVLVRSGPCRRSAPRSMRPVAISAWCIKSSATVRST